MTVKTRTYLFVFVLVVASWCATSQVDSTTADQFLGSWVAQEFSSKDADEKVRQAIKWITFKADGQVEYRYEQLEPSASGYQYIKTHSGPYMIIDGRFYYGATPTDSVPEDNIVVLQNMKIERHRRHGQVLKAETHEGRLVMFVRMKR